MIGAIVGDIVGSRFEFNNHRSKEFDLFADGCFATDDSIMSLAVAKSILEASKVKFPNSRGYDADFYSALSDLTVKYMQEIGRKYPNCGFGGMFYQWVFSDSPKPYNSFGNGAAMRVSPAGFAVNDEWEVIHLAETVTKVTHSHEEGLKGAKATAVAIAMARRGALKSEIRERIIAEYYSLDFRIDDIRPTYKFNETCQETVPQAIECFLESNSFEDAIRTAISLGGDSDTIGAITGAIAEAYYGVPDEIKEKALAYLDDELRAIYDEWVEFAPANSESGFQRDEQDFLIINNSANIDVLDENLYGYDSTVFSLTPAIQRRASEGLFRKIKEFTDSAPAMGKAADAVKDKIEYIPRLDLIPDDIKQVLQNGSAELIPCKNASGAFFLQIRTTVKGLVINGKECRINQKIKDIPLGTKTVPADVTGAMQCLSMQNQLNQIANGLREISEACEFNFGRLIQGQRDDRLAKLLSSRSSFIQALAMSDESLRRQMLIQAVGDANSARAELAFQIKSDIALLGGDKPPKVKDMEKMVKDINTAIIAMNNAVQLSLYSYQVLGERNAQLAVVKEHETFIKQVLLKEIEREGNKYPAWRLICSSGNSRLAPRDFGSLPTKLIDSCTAFIEDKKTTHYLEGESNGK